MKILILEDEDIIAKRLARLITEILDQPATISCVSYLDEALEQMSKNSIDLLFLDLNLNGENGFEILEQMAGESFQTIIVSANEDQAIHAFEYGVLDFVPKPFGRERLEKAIGKYLQPEQPGGQTKFLTIKKRGRIISIKLEDVLYIQGASTYSELHFKNGSKDLHSKSLSGLMKILPSSYQRIHKSHIVDMNSVKEIAVKTGGKYSLVLENDVRIPLGRSYYKAIKKKWFSE